MNECDWTNERMNKRDWTTLHAVRPQIHRAGEHREIRGEHVCVLHQQSDVGARRDAARRGGAELNAF